MFSKMLIFIICFISFFALMFALIPGGFLAASFNSSAGTDTDIAEFYSAANITMYNIQQNFSLSYPGTQEYDLPGITGHQLQFWWGDDFIGGNSFPKVLEVRHLTDQIFGIWWGWHRLTIEHGYDFYPNYYYIGRTIILEEYDATLNGSFFDAGCDHVPLNFFVRPDVNDTLENAWDYGQVRIIASYEINWNATSISGFNILSQIMTFQAPNLGFNDSTLNLIFNILIAAPIYTMIAILVYKAVTSLFPTVPGVPD